MNGLTYYKPSGLVLSAKGVVPGLAPGAPSNQFASLLANLYLQYKLNEASGNAIDSNGNLDLATIGSDPGTATGKVNQCRTIGVAGGFTSNATASAAGIGTDWSLSAWMYFGGIGATYDVFTCRQIASGNLCWMIRSETTSLKMYVGDSVGNFSSTTVGTVSSTTWYHFACSFKLSTKELRYRFNGGTVTSFTSTYAPTVTTNQKVSIACDGSFGGAETMPSGSRVDVMKFWTRQLSDAELLLDYNGGNGVEL